MRNPDTVPAFKKWFNAKVDEAAKLPTNEFATGSYVVTAEIADYLLQHHNNGNRPVRKAKLVEWRKILTGGKYRKNSQGFSISNERPPRLNNGQHRLLSILETGIPIDVLFVFGEDRDVFALLDNGDRNVTDAVRIKFPEWNKTDATVAADAAQLFFRIVHEEPTKKISPD